MDSQKLASRLRTLQQALAPLVKLVCKLTELETAFVTYIDPVLGQQQVIVVESDGALNIMPGAENDWQESMCRRLFNDDDWIKTDIQQCYPDSGGAKLGMTTFFALPVKHNTKVVGSLCGASVHPKELTPAHYEQMHLIAQALSWQVQQWLRLSKLQQRLVRTRQHLKQAFQDKESMRQLSERDPLTGLLNRRGFADLWQSCVEQEAVDGDVTVLALDFDNFKQLNDNFGHQAGDHALLALAEILKQCTRDYDFACRLGGDEFLLVLPGCKRLQAMQIAERIQAEYALTTQGKYHGISIGVAVSCEGATDDLLLLADKALYQAKNNGRGCVVIKMFRD